MSKVVALLVSLLTLADPASANTPPPLPAAIVEATPEIARHLNVKDGQLRVGDAEVWTALRRFHVTLVENPDLDLRAKADAPAGAALLLQLKVSKIDIGISAISGLLRERTGKLLFEEPDPAAPRQYPYSVTTTLDTRLRIPGAVDYSDNAGASFFFSKGVTEYPDAKAKAQALGEALLQIDDSLNWTIGGQMLDVRLSQEVRRTFHVRVKNVYPFPVAGSVRFPADDEYRVDVAQLPFHLKPGDTADLSFKLEMADPDADFVYPKWWTRKVYGTRERNNAFQFPRLELNVAVDGR